jgi:hypothetical protein
VAVEKTKPKTKLAMLLKTNDGEKTNPKQTGELTGQRLACSLPSSPIFQLP